MCGIAGIHVKRNAIGNGMIPVEGLVDGLLWGIEPRGKDATGFVAVSAGAEEVVYQKIDERAHVFTAMRDDLPRNLRTVLLHTRLATQGPPKDNENNHPVLVDSCYVTHNGVIYNDYSIFADLDVERAAAVDSIVIPTLVSECGLREAEKGLERLMGSFAVAIIDPVKNPDELVLARGDSSPLILLETRNFWMWASTQYAIEDAYKWFYGTPPAKDKFRTVEEGTIIKIDSEDRVTEEKFSCPTRTTYWSGSNYGRPQNTGSHTHSRRWPGGGSYFLEDEDDGTAFVWDDDANTWVEYIEQENAKDIIRDAQGEPYFCFQCGEEYATKTVKDKKERSNKTIEWDYPLCAKCYLEVGDNPAELALTYRYARGVTLQETKKRPTVERMTYSKNVFVTPPGKNVSTILRPGDKIPLDYQDAFLDCEACGGKPEWIGMDGFAICSGCHDSETRNYVAQLTAGDSCDTGCENEDEALNLELDEDMQTCSVCSRYKVQSQMTNTVFGYFCESCALRQEGGFDTTEGEVIGFKNLHLRTCAEVAWEMDLSRDYVAWLLDDCGSKRLQEQEQLMNQFKACTKLYSRRFKQIEVLLRNGRDDLLDAVPMDVPAYQEAKRLLDQEA